MQRRNNFLRTAFLASLIATSGTGSALAQTPDAAAPMSDAQMHEHMMEHHHDMPAAPAAGGGEVPVVTLDAANQDLFDHGHNFMMREWDVAPGPDPQHDGLGPLYNQISCRGCHHVSVKRHVPDKPGDPMVSALVRLSVMEKGKAVGHPVYGSQLQDHGIPGVPAEGQVDISYVESAVALADGTTVPLRKPAISFRALAYGPLDGAMTSLRVAPSIMGMGLLDLVPEATLLEYADEKDANHDGISGRPNRIADARTGRSVIGRFGWKANQPDLATQIASALHDDMGLTTAMLRDTPCTQAEAACVKATSGGDPEIADFMFANVMAFQSYLAPPPRRHAEEPETQHGEALFRATGCAGCHRETLKTGDSTRYPQLAQLTFHPYTDLLLHDMGEGLADGRPDHDANGSEWRTAPLWGVARVADDGSTRFLHDGRARSLTEAILWHGGEAEGARERFRAMSATDRAALLRFLDSL